VKKIITHSASEANKSHQPSEKQFVTKSASEANISQQTE
jgi:hypothetical protein